MERVIGPPRLNKKPKVIGSPELEKFLISQDGLNKYAHLTIVQRVVQIKKDYNAVASRWRLRQLYIRNNIKYKRTKTTFMNYDKYTPEQLEAMRREYAGKLQAYIDKDLPIIYMDEVSTVVGLHLLLDNFFDVEHQQPRLVLQEPQPQGGGAPKCRQTKKGKAVFYRLRGYFDGP